MTRKQATIAVRSGLNDDEQYGCVVPPIHLSSTYNFTGFNEPRATTTLVAVTRPVMWCSVRWRSWRAAGGGSDQYRHVGYFAGHHRIPETGRSAGGTARLLRWQLPPV